jgi:hypothetical protein
MPVEPEPPGPFATPEPPPVDDDVVPVALVVVDEPDEPDEPPTELVEPDPTVPPEVEPDVPEDIIAEGEGCAAIELMSALTLLAIASTWLELSVAADVVGVVLPALESEVVGPPVVDDVEPPPPEPLRLMLIGVGPKSPPKIQAATGANVSSKSTISVPLPAGVVSVAGSSTAATSTTGAPGFVGVTVSTAGVSSDAATPLSVGVGSVMPRLRPAVRTTGPLTVATRSPTLSVPLTFGLVAVTPRSILLPGLTNDSPVVVRSTPAARSTPSEAPTLKTGGGLDGSGVSKSPPLPGLTSSATDLRTQPGPFTHIAESAFAIEAVM